MFVDPGRLGKPVRLSLRSAPVVRQQRDSGTVMML
jgi:hypothetical protein